LKRLKNMGNKLISVSFLVLMIIIWQIISVKGIIPKYILPSPKDIGIVFIKILPELWHHILVTLWEALAGLGLAILFSLGLAVTMDNIPIIKKALYPLLIISQTIPIIALAPLFLIWFGFSILPKIIVVILVCFFPIAISLADGLASVDLDMLNMMKSMGADKIQIFWHLKLPYGIVGFFSGLRISVTYSIMGAIIGEWLGGEKGIGVYMMRVKHSYALDKFFASILVIVILSVLLFKTVDFLEYVFMPWRKGQKESNT
jgi:ABC-type nitrate/sulfonate/bicarbonate transport system permease component